MPSNSTSDFNFPAEAMLRLDAAVGSLTVDELYFAAGTRLDALGPRFQVSAPQQVCVEQREVSCCFARMRFSEQGQPRTLCLRFDDGVLTGGSISLDDADIAFVDWDSYDSDKAYARHAAWLQRQLGDIDIAYQRYPWGNAGVGRSKSEDVFIYFHFGAD
ncbi:hypothetical protein SAMN02745857_03875 [Andreprevotia lacus DSM 23236]|jgi:hypothetical protein|uniref:Uncharacterized protein n=1 Tax=Andreprevotia lacus DSM 23236 TaxID=1121001 RepID=A0A1W1XZU9_9NEIS|nr:hypothetical protein [Andreprevotia lacus]SMC29490.1 hypothetical protein SAMN02745857_03875 [Andreprevotia lacus DSM 23236]